MTVTTPAPPIAEEQWVWYHQVPEWFTQSGVSDAGVADRTSAHRAGQAMQISATRRNAGIVVRCEEIDDKGAPRVPPKPVWERTLTGEGERATLMARPSEVFVVLRTAAGFRALALDLEGKGPRFDVAVAIPELVGAPATIQLGVRDDRLLVYTRGPAAGYLDRLDARTGAKLSRTVAENDLLFERLEAPPGAIETRPLGERWPVRDGAYAVIEQDERAVVERRDARDRPQWRTVLDGVRPFHDHAAVLEIGGQPIVVWHSPIAADVDVWALDADSGAIRWRARPNGIGSVKHSEYSNKVSATTDAQGRLVLFGAEASGSYIAVLDPATGTVLSDEVWR